MQKARVLCPWIFSLKRVLFYCFQDFSEFLSEKMFGNIELIFLLCRANQYRTAQLDSSFLCE